MLNQITSFQLAEWEAYSRLEPFGPLREDARFGMLAAATANCSFAKKKDDTPFMPDDFIPTPESRMDELDDLPSGPKKQTADEMLGVLMGLPGVVVKKRDE